MLHKQAPVCRSAFDWAWVVARRVFFAFKYDPDVHRAWVVRNSWVTKTDREGAGFFDSSVFESKRRTSEDALKQFLKDGLSGSTVTCVLTGALTASSRWVRYELLRSFCDGKGIINIAIHGIANLQKQTATAGANPLSYLGAEVFGATLKFKEYKNGNWAWSADVPSMPIASVKYALNGNTNFTFDMIFSSYNWVTNDGYNNISKWVEAAAKAAGRS